MSVRSLDFDIGWNINSTKLKKADRMTDEFKQDVAGAENKMTDLAKTSEKTGKTITSSMKESRQATNKFTGSMKGIGNKLEDNKEKLAGMTAAATTGLGFAVKSAANFESQMVRVGQISGANKKQLTALTEEAKRLGIESAFSAKEAAKGQEYLARAGFSVKENMEALPDVLNLAASEQMKLGQTSDITSDILTGFGLKASEMTRVVDVLKATSAGANTDVGMLGESMKYVGSTAQNLGFSIESMSGALGLMANAGIKGGQAGRYLRSSINKLVKPTKEGSKLLDDLGVNLTDSQGDMKSFTNIVGQFESKMQGMTKAQKQNALATIFGQEAATGMLSIINQGSDELNSFTQELKNSSGITEKMAKEQMNTLSGSFKQLRGSISVAAISIGSSLAPAINVVAKGITGLVNGFNKLPDPIRNTIGISLGLSTSLLGIATAIGFLVGPINNFLGTALGKWAKSMVIARWQTVKLGAKMTWLRTKELAGLAKQFIVTKTKAIASYIKGTIAAKWATFKLGAKMTWLRTKELAGLAKQFIVTKTKAIASYIKGTIAAKWATFKLGAKMLWTKTKAVASFAWSLVKQGANSAYTFSASLVKSAIPAIGSFATSLYTSAVGALTTVGTSLTTAATATWGFTTALLSNPITWVVAGVAGLTYGLYKLATNWDVVKEKTLGFISSAGNKLRGFFGYIKNNPLKSLFRFAVPAVNLIKPINSAYSKARNWLNEHTALELPEFKFPSVDKIFNKIESKIKWLKDKLQVLDFGGAIKQGIKDTKSKAIGAVEGMTQKVRNFLPFSPANLFNKLASL